jgi:hypothetical protein
MNLRKLLGLLLMVAAVAGIIFCIIGLIGVWQIKPTLTQTVSENLALLDDTLIATQDGLTAIGQLVQTTATDVASLQTTTQALAQTIHDTNPMLDSLTSLAGNDLPDAITAAQTSLASAQSSAQLIDTVLGALTSIPFSPVAQYKPEVPLAASLSQVSTSLDTLPPALATIHTSLTAGKTNLSVVESELTNISTTVKGISNNLGSAQQSIDQYKTVTTKLKDRVEAAQRTTPTLITTLSWIFTILLVWLVISQLGLWAQGFDLLQSRRSAMDQDRNQDARLHPITPALQRSDV